MATIKAIVTGLIQVLTVGHATHSRSYQPSVGAALIATLLSAILLGGCAAGRVVDRHPGLLYQTIQPGAHSLFKEVVEEAAAAGLPPMSVTFDVAEAGLADFRLDLNFTIRDKGLTDTEVIWTLTTMVLLTLYPSSCGRYELELTGDLYDQGGSRLKSWHLVEQDTAFLWLFQGKDCGTEQSEITVEKIAAEMLKQLYARMSRDGVLSGRAIPIDNYPLVYISTSNASSVVQRITKTEEPFPNFTFDSEAGKSAERTLKINFDFISPEQSMGSIMGRGMAMMMTMGVVSMCSPNKIVLEAEVLAADGTMLRTYRYSKKKRASMSSDCAPATDQTHPKLVADMLRKLFRQIKKDKVI